MDASEGAVTTAAAPYIGRFAPSPTGALHFGSLVAAVASYADARSVNGRWLLRIEDVDTTRCSMAAETRIRAQLALHGFEPDGPVLRQRERGERYAAALERLRACGHVYACACSRRALAGAPRNADGETIYPGHCRELALGPEGHALRLRVPDGIDGEIAFSDRAAGDVRQHLAPEVGDFVLRRADGIWAYQLAVVVDDAEQHVTDVVRGADLLGNTPRQIHLQRRLGVATPRYLHVPLVRDSCGDKLSKQTHAAELADDEVLPALHAAWRWLGQAALPTVATPAAFWRLAIDRWDGGQIPRDSRQ